MPLKDRYNLDEIRAYWTEQARAHSQSPAASWSDRMVIDMEIREISKYLAAGSRVLDVGCANGYSTLKFAEHCNITIRGLDYIPEMVAEASARLTNAQADVAARISFDVGDITAIREQDAAYDRVVVIRVVINLGTWDRQLQALRECARVLRPGGLLLLSEATVQGWNLLNQFRREWGLPDIPMPAFNLYLDQDLVKEATADLFEMVDLVNFASTYYVGTRVLKPLLAKLPGGAVDASDPDMHWNRWFAHLPAAGDYGTQKLFVLRRK
jgi:ubiquinone/menaquinone biosynthesis C-methylase UbiE